MTERPGFYLPDFCRARSVLAVILIAELVALLFTLARHGISASFWPDLAQISLFLLWAALGTAAAWCAARSLLSKLDVFAGSAVALALMLLVTAAVTEGAWWLAAYSDRLVGIEGRTSVRDHMDLVLRNLAICAIAGGLALRYFYVAHQWRSNVEAEAQSRVRALQARIRPHFLFNSMNTIASLTRTNPRAAEQAIADLSDLFRASLREHRERIPLASEIEIARAYERVERLRLGDRLKVDWQIDELPMEASVPALVLQPLLENAVYHGIEPLEKGGTIRVSGKREGSMAVLTIDNPVAAKLVARRPGHQIGLDNVRQRFELMYHGDAQVEVFEAPERFVVTLRFPAGGPARMNLRVLVVDDEPLARERLSHLVEELPGVELAGVAASGEEALLLAGRLRPEVVLLDIRMPGMDGLETAHHLARMPEPPAVIFTTAYEQHALAAFDAQAAGYLLKPVRPDKLKETLERARRPTRAQLTRIAEGMGGPRTRIAVRARDELRLIPVENILCFIAEQKYTTLRHKDGEELIEEPLKSLEEEFAGQFVRVHRNSLVAIRHIFGLEKNAEGQQVVRLQGGGSLAVSRRLAADVVRVLSSKPTPDRS